MAKVDVRMRLATSQTVLALAAMNDGSIWQARTDVLVTLAACVEGG
ncbi:MAG TPA: thiosulfate oxidation carrier protein SoxY [Rubrivivax sp.]|nr:thiosulfate oxidation carrier protein SoxY [Rubrivivax sp.]